MKKTIILILILTLTLLCSCAQKGIKLPEGARTIDGCYENYTETITTAYVFTPDGFGYQFIGDDLVFEIYYYILDDTITIDNFTLNDIKPVTFDYLEAEDCIFIGGLQYIKADENELSRMAQVK